MDEPYFETSRRISKNFQWVMERIEHATRVSGRSQQSVKLVVVTKRQPVELIRAVITAGACYLGENYGDEALLKIDDLRGYQEV